MSRATKKRRLGRIQNLCASLSAAFCVRAFPVEGPDEVGILVVNRKGGMGRSYTLEAEFFRSPRVMSQFVIAAAQYAIGARA